MYSKATSLLQTPSSLLLDLEKEYPFTRFDKFFTMFYMILDVKSGFLKYSSAGHPPAILQRRDNTRISLSAGGAMVGLGANVPFEEATVQLQAGDRLIVYTDGIYEFTNPDGELFGMDRFYNAVGKQLGFPLTASLETIFQELTTFGRGAPIYDDCTLLILQYSDSGEIESPM